MIGWRDYGTDNIRHSKIFVTIRKLLLCDFFLNQERNKMRKKTHKVVLVVGEEERERERERYGTKTFGIYSNGNKETLT